MISHRLQTSLIRYVRYRNDCKIVDYDSMFITVDYNSNDYNSM